MSVAVNDERTITVRIGDVEAKITLSEAKSLYEKLGNLPGVAPLADIRPKSPYRPWARPYEKPWPSGPYWIDPSVIPGIPSRPLEVWCTTKSSNTKPNDAIMVY